MQYNPEEDAGRLQPMQLLGRPRNFEKKPLPTSGNCQSKASVGSICSQIDTFLNVMSNREGLSRVAARPILLTIPSASALQTSCLMILEGEVNSLRKVVDGQARYDSEYQVRRFYKSLRHLCISVDQYRFVCSAGAKSRSWKEEDFVVY